MRLKAGMHIRLPEYGNIGAVILRVFDNGDVLVQADPTGPVDREAEKDLPEEVKAVLAEARALTDGHDHQEPIRLKRWQIKPG